jgi:SsrA-binding protein
MSIDEYSFGNAFNHQPKSERKLLLNKQELKKLKGDVQDVGLTIIPLRLFLNEKGWAKLDIALCRGKKYYDKRENIKTRQNKIELDRVKKNFNK